MKKVVAYLRVSTKEQSVDLQKRDLEKWAKKEEWDVTWVEEKMSARKTRPRLEEVMKSLRRKEYDGLIVWNMDRLARSVVHMIQTLDELHQLGLIFRSYLW